MKVKFKKPYRTKSRTYQPGELQRFARRDAKRMVRQGYAETTDEADEKDIMAAEHQVAQFESKLQSYPVDARGICRQLEFERDPAIAQSFLDDKRKTVRDKARDVLKELK